MTTIANVLSLAGMVLIRFGGRGGGGLVVTLFGMAVVGTVVWALTRPVGPEAAKDGSDAAGK